MANDPSVPTAAHAPPLDDESAEAVFAQAAKDHRTPMLGQDDRFLSWLGWLWLPLWILGRLRR